VRIEVLESAAEAPSPAGPAPETPPEPRISVAAPDEPAPQAPPTRPPARGGEGLLDQARQEPGVRQLMDAFGAHVVNVRRHDDGPPKPRRAGRPARAPEDTP